MNTSAAFWIIFNVVILTVMFVDLRFMQKDGKPMGLKKAALWYLFCMSLALIFDAGIYFYMSKEKAAQFLTGYVIEQSLSIDNLFVFLMIFNYFGVADRFQPRVLHWGILGAIVMRFVVIFGGTALLNAFHWIFYVFGFMIIVTGIRMLKDEEKKLDPNKNLALRAFKSFMPVAVREIHDDLFFVRLNGILHATPLFVALVIVESSDLIFAVDSIPAIFAITTDSFIVYTSNVFAILGLRALYFLLSSLMPLFVYLKYGISIVLCFVGVKMMLMEVYKIPTGVSLLTVLFILTASVLLSLVAGKPKKTGHPS